MRKLIVANIVSLDGYYEGPDGNVMTLFERYRDAYPSDESFDEFNAGLLRTSGALLTGSTSYNMFRSYWPPIAADENAPALQREISQLTRAIVKIVISDTVTEEQTQPWHNTRIFRRETAVRQVARAKQEPGDDIVVFGSRTAWSELMANGLVDELHLMVAPVVLGEGTPLFAGPRPTLRLLDAQTSEGAGSAILRYQVVNPEA